LITLATYVLVHGGAHGGWCYRRVAKLLRAAGRLWDIDTGHDLMISEPDAVAELLLQVAAP